MEKTSKEPEPRDLEQGTTKEIINHDVEAEQETRTIDEARERLKNMSQEVKPLVEAGKYEHINEALIEAYKDENNTEFKSYQEWLKEGYQVRKGEKAFLLWGKPKEIEKTEGKEEQESKSEKEEGYTYFPVAYVFSNAQVDKREHELEEIRTKAKVQEQEMDR